MILNLLVTSIILYLALLLAKAFLSLRYKSNFALPKHATVVEAVTVKRVTIVQPILSGDPLLEESLEHNLRCMHEFKDAPQVSFLWLIDDDDSEAQRIASKLQNVYSNIQVVFCPKVPEDLNPKAFKLQLALEHIRTPNIAIVDDDTMLSKQSLGQALYSLENSKATTIVTGLPYYLSGTSLWSRLVSHFVNNNSIVTYLPLLNFMEPLSINGMFYIMRKDELEQLGAFKSIWKQLSDDFAMACLIQDNGGKIIQTPTTHAVQTSVKDLKHYIQLMHRWFLFAQTQISHQRTSTTILVSLMLGLPALLLWTIVILSISALITSLANLAFGSLALVILYLLVFSILRHFTLRYLHKHFLQEPPSFSVALSLLAELLQPLHMLHALVHKRIVWRSRHIRLEADGKFSYIQDVTK